MSDEEHPAAGEAGLVPTERTLGFTLLVGGARSGKSSLAVRLAVASRCPVTFVATAGAGDDDMAARIAHHRAERPAHWTTVEEEVDLLAAVERIDAGSSRDDGAMSFVVVDCVTMWVANLLGAGRSDDQVRQAAVALGDGLAGRAAASVVIANEVGMGIHPETELGRRYRDLLGWVNADLAARARRSLLLVAGRALRLEEPMDLVA